MPIGENETTYRNRAESTEVNFEGKEAADKELEKKMGAKERAEVVGSEVKTAQGQMQKIMANAASVAAAVRAIRQQLQLSDDGSIPSLQRDEQTLAVLKKKLERLYGELTDLRQALIVEEVKSLREQHTGWNEAELTSAAQARVDEWLTELGITQETGQFTK